MNGVSVPPSEVSLGSFSNDTFWKATVTGSKFSRLNMSMRMRVIYSLSYSPPPFVVYDGKIAD